MFKKFESTRSINTSTANITTPFFTIYPICFYFSPLHTSILLLVPNSSSKVLKTQNPRQNFNEHHQNSWKTAKMRGILRRLVGCRQPFTSSGRSSELGQTLMVSSAATISYSTVTFMEKPNLLCGFPIAANLLPDFQSRHVLNHYRNFSAPSSSGLSVTYSISISCCTHFH